MKVYLCRIVVPTIIVKLHAIILIHGLFWCMIWPKPLHIFHFHIDSIEYLLSFVIYFFLFIQNFLFFHLTHELISISSQFKLKTNESYIFNSSKIKRKKLTNHFHCSSIMPIFSVDNICCVFASVGIYTECMIDFNTRDNFSFISLTTQLGFFSTFVGFSEGLLKNIDIFIFSNNKNTLKFNYFEIERVLKVEWINKNSRSKGS